MAKGKTSSTRNYESASKGDKNKGGRVGKEAKLLVLRRQEA